VVRKGAVETRRSYKPMKFHSPATCGDDNFAFLRALAASEPTSLEDLDFGFDIPASCIGECSALLGSGGPGGEFGVTSENLRFSV
jgi:hypothetical protein